MVGCVESSVTFLQITITDSASSNDVAYVIIGETQPPSSISYSQGTISPGDIQRLPVSHAYNSLDLVDKQRGIWRDLTCVSCVRFVFDLYRHHRSAKTCTVNICGTGRRDLPKWCRRDRLACFRGYIPCSAGFAGRWALLKRKLDLAKANCKMTFLLFWCYRKRHGPPEQYNDFQDEKDFI